MHWIYVIVNTQDPVWIYVGTSVDPYQRFIKHCSKSSRCRRFRNAIKKYGREHFELNVIRSFDTKEEAYNYEVVLISQMLADGHRLYNLTSGGEGATGRTVRKRTREKLSATMKAKRGEERERTTIHSASEDQEAAK